MILGHEQKMDSKSLQNPKMHGAEETDPVVTVPSRSCPRAWEKFDVFPLSIVCKFQCGTMDFRLSKSRMTVGSDHLKLSFTSLPRKGVTERT